MQLLPWVHSRGNAASAIRYREKFGSGTAELAERYVTESGNGIRKAAIWRELY
jgi:predicted transcriptional regulator